MILTFISYSLSFATHFLLLITYFFYTHFLLLTFFCISISSYTQFNLVINFFSSSLSFPLRLLFVLNFSIYSLSYHTLLIIHFLFSLFSFLLSSRTHFLLNSFSSHLTFFSFSFSFSLPFRSHFLATLLSCYCSMDISHISLLSIVVYLILIFMRFYTSILVLTLS
jgi:hypothetical protein